MIHPMPEINTLIKQLKLSYINDNLPQRTNRRRYCTLWSGFTFDYGWRRKQTRNVQTLYGYV